MLDLRGNGGGYLAAAISIADEFLSDGNMIVYTEGRQEGIQKVLQRDRGYLKAYRLWSLLMKVLPLQVKLLQAQFKITTEAQLLVVELLEKAWYRRKKLADGSAFRLTIARYYTPVGRCIQKPYDKGIVAYETDLENRLKQGN